MQVILSRKGFDSQNGGYPSPILDDGSLISLPIPLVDDSDSYCDLKLPDSTYYYDLMSQLKNRIKVKGKWEYLSKELHCHRDPDIYQNIIQRTTCWRGCFGQSRQSQTHLERQNVNQGDLFLFFGWFKRASKVNGRLQFVKGSSDLHVVYGYLEVEEKRPLPEPNLEKWLLTHPHVRKKRWENDTLYIATKKLSFDNRFAGSGVFKFDNSLILTKEGNPKSRWRLNELIGESVPISYHSPNSWKEGYFQSGAIGQAFVIQSRKSVEDWAKRLVIENSK